MSIRETLNKLVKDSEGKLDTTPLWLLGFVFAVMAVGFWSGPPPEPIQLRYFKDKRTGICFVTYRQSVVQSVACTPEVMQLIEKN